MRLTKMMMYQVSQYIGCTNDNFFYTHAHIFITDLVENFDEASKAEN